MPSIFCSSCSDKADTISFAWCMRVVSTTLQSMPAHKRAYIYDDMHAGTDA